MTKQNSVQLEYTLTFERFKEIIEREIADMELDDAIRDATKKYSEKTRDMVDIWLPSCGYNAIELLDEMLKTEMVSAWLYDMECGKNQKFNYAVLEDGSRYDLSSIESLWNFIMMMR